MEFLKPGENFNSGKKIYKGLGNLHLWCYLLCKQLYNDLLRERVVVLPKPDIHRKSEILAYLPNALFAHWLKLNWRRMGRIWWGDSPVCGEERLPIHSHVSILLSLRWKHWILQCLNKLWESSKSPSLPPSFLSSTHLPIRSVLLNHLLLPWLSQQLPWVIPPHSWVAALPVQKCAYTVT